MFGNIAVASSIRRRPLPQRWLGSLPRRRLLSRRHCLPGWRWLHSLLHLLVFLLQLLRLLLVPLFGLLLPGFVGILFRDLLVFFLLFLREFLPFLFLLRELLFLLLLVFLVQIRISRIGWTGSFCWR